MENELNRVMSCYPMAKGLIRKLRPLEPEDALQEAMLAVVQLEKRFKPNATFTTAAYPRIRGAILDWKVKERGRVADISDMERGNITNDEQGDFEILCKRPGPLQIAMQCESAERLNAAILKLTERQQVILRLYYIEGMTMDEIAEKMGLSQYPIVLAHKLALLTLRTLL